MKVFIVDMFGCKKPDLGYQIKAAFEQLGHSVEAFNYRKYKFQHFPITNKLLNMLMIRKAKSSDADLVLVNKGETILPGTIDKIRKNGAKTVSWNPDEPFGHLVDFNRIKNIAEYDAYFTYDSQYVKELKEINPKTYHLPPGADPEGVYKEQISFTKRVFPADICLVGTAYENRINLMKPYVDYKLRLAGHGWDKAPRLLARQSISAVKITEMTKLFNESKIVLNPYGASKHFIVPNPRTFEIPATKSFQLTSMPREAGKYFRLGKEIAVYKDEKEFRELVDYYLENDEERNEIALAGYERVMKEHTMKHRVEEILKKVNIYS